MDDCRVASCMCVFPVCIQRQGSGGSSYHSGEMRSGEGVYGQPHSSGFSAGNPGQVHMHCHSCQTCYVHAVVYAEWFFCVNLCSLPPPPPPPPFLLRCYTFPSFLFASCPPLFSYSLSPFIPSLPPPFLLRCYTFPSFLFASCPPLFSYSLSPFIPSLPPPFLLRCYTFPSFLFASCPPLFSYSLSPFIPSLPPPFLLRCYTFPSFLFPSCPPLFSYSLSPFIPSLPPSAPLSTRARPRL